MFRCQLTDPKQTACGIRFSPIMGKTLTEVPVSMKNLTPDELSFTYSNSPSRDKKAVEPSTLPFVHFPLPDIGTCWWALLPNVAWYQHKGLWCESSHVQGPLQCWCKICSSLSMWSKIFLISSLLNQLALPRLEVHSFSHIHSNYVAIMFFWRCWMSNGRILRW